MTRQELPSDPLLWLREGGDVDPPEGAEARVAARLASVAIAAGPIAPGAAPSASSPHGPIKLLADRFVRWSLVPLGLGVGLGAGLGSGISAARDGEQLRSQLSKPGLSVASAIRARAATRRVEPARPQVEEEPPPTAAVASAPGSSSLKAERDLLDRARRELSSSEPMRSLSILEQHARRFPRGRLSEEREAMWVNALALLGRAAEAEVRAKAFEERFPSSLMGSSVRAAVRAANSEQTREK